MDINSMDTIREFIKDFVLDYASNTSALEITELRDRYQNELDYDLLRGLAPGLGVFGIRINDQPNRVIEIINSHGDALYLHYDGLLQDEGQYIGDADDTTLDNPELM